MNMGNAICAAMIIFSALAYGEDTGKAFGSANEAAQKTLDGFKTLMDDSLARILGFHDAADGKAAKLGRPIRVYDLDSAAIMGTITSSNPADPRTMSDREKYYFPMEDSFGKSRSLIMVTRLKEIDGNGKKDLWRPVQVGAAPLMRQLDNALRNQPPSRIPGIFVAESPGMGAVFLGFESGREIRLVPAALEKDVDSCMQHPDRRTDLAAGRFLSALGKCYQRITIFN